MSVVWYLEGLQGQYKGEEIPLPREVIWLGRAVAGTPNSPTHKFFEDGSVSRVHAALAWTPEFEAFVIHHRSQTNPTFLNDLPVSQPQLLKEDDILSFGHQKLKVAARTAGLAAVEPGTVDSGAETLDDSGPPTKVSRPTSKFTLCYKYRGDTFTVQAGGEFLFQFTPETHSLENPPAGEPSQSVRIPARQPATLRFAPPAQDGSLKLDVLSDKPVTTRRTTTSGKLVLEVPFAPGESLSVTALDVIHHQGIEIWPDDGPGENRSESTLEMDMAKFQDMRKDEKNKGILEFQNGPCKGTHVTIYPGDISMEIGPGKVISGHEIPLEGGPTCRISFQDLVPHVEVVEVVEGQYVSVNGELLFSTQSYPLISGSAILLGRTMLHWTQPELQKELSAYKLHSEEHDFPVSRAVMRIGSASHCEVLIEGQGVAGVAGTLEYTPEGFYYKHLDGSIPAHVDGEVAISGDRLKLSDNSSIDIGTGSSLQLIKK